MTADRNRQDVMSLDEFTHWLSSAFDWCPPEVAETDDLVGDLGMDSVGAVDLMVGIEDAVGGGLVMPIELMLEIHTVRDAYLQYCALAQLPLDEAAR